MDQMDIQPGANGQPQVPQDMNQQQPQQPMQPPAPQMGGGMIPTNVQPDNKLRWGIGLMLGAMIMLVPLGLYKIGSPTPCTPDRQKRGECTILPSVPDKCTPSAFSQDVYGLQLLMTHLIDRKTKEALKQGNLVLESKKTTDEEAGDVERLVFPKNPYDLSCFATPALIKFKYKDQKIDIIDIPELDIMKMNVLTNVDPSMLQKDLFFTVLIMIILLVMMGVAAWMGMKKNLDAYLHVLGVFVIGFFAAYLYRYYVAAFYTQDIVVLLLSLLGAIPIGMLMAAKPREEREIVPEYLYQTGGRQYYLTPGPVEIEEPTYGPLDPSEMTPFIRALMKKDYLTISVVGLFLLVVLSLIPIGLISMGKTSRANQAMQDEAAKLSMLIKKQEQAESSFDMQEDEDTNGDEDEDAGE